MSWPPPVSVVASVIRPDCWLYDSAWMVLYALIYLGPRSGG